MFEDISNKKPEKNLLLHKTIKVLLRHSSSPESITYRITCSLKQWRTKHAYDIGHQKAQFKNVEHVETTYLGGSESFMAMRGSNETSNTDRSSYWKSCSR